MVEEFDEDYGLADPRPSTLFRYKIHEEKYIKVSHNTKSTDKRKPLRSANEKDTLPMEK